MGLLENTEGVEGEIKTIKPHKKRLTRSRTTGNNPTLQQYTLTQR